MQTAEGRQCQASISASGGGQARVLDWKPFRYCFNSTTIKCSFYIFIIFLRPNPLGDIHYMDFTKQIFIFRVYSSAMWRASHTFIFLQFCLTRHEMEDIESLYWFQWSKVMQMESRQCGWTPQSELLLIKQHGISKTATL